MNRINKLIITINIALSLAACTKNETEPTIVVPAPSVSTLTLEGLIGAEDGAAAGNIVYVNLSTDTQSPVARISWDLGFYAGANFRVILNNTTSAGALVLPKTNLTEVGESDTLNLTLSTNLRAPSAEHFTFFDNLNASITSTVIPEVSVTDTDNRVILLNRGTGGGIPARPWLKFKVTRNTTGGYTLQYGTITQTTNFSTVQIQKDPAYNFKFISLNTGSEVSVEPTKSDWDFVWGNSIYKTPGGVPLAYSYSDLVFINTFANIEVAEVMIAGNITYETFNTANLTSSSVTFSKDRDVIGANWRTIDMNTRSILFDRFYVIKDAKGNTYKLRFNSFGGTEGGTRGKPVIQYELLN